MHSPWGQPAESSGMRAGVMWLEHGKQRGRSKDEIRAVGRGQSMWGPGVVAGTWILSQMGSHWRVFAEKQRALISILKDDSGCHMEDGFHKTPFSESQFAHLYNGFMRNLVKSITKGCLADS